jgi:hypothetical protein
MAGERRVESSAEPASRDPKWGPDSVLVLVDDSTTSWRPLAWAAGIAGAARARLVIALCDQLSRGFYLGGDIMCFNAAFFDLADERRVVMERTLRSACGQLPAEQVVVWHIPALGTNVPRILRACEPDLLVVPGSAPARM